MPLAMPILILQAERPPSLPSASAPSVRVRGCALTSFAGLPAQQARCLHSIIRLTEDTGMSPTLEKIAADMDCTKQWVGDLVLELKKKGRIKHEAGKHRSIEVVEKKDETLIKNPRRT